MPHAFSEWLNPHSVGIMAGFGYIDNLAYKFNLFNQLPGKLTMDRFKYLYFVMVQFDKLLLVCIVGYFLNVSFNNGVINKWPLTSPIMMFLRLQQQASGSGFNICKLSA